MPINGIIQPEDFLTEKGTVTVFRPHPKIPGRALL